MQNNFNTEVVWPTISFITVTFNPGPCLLSTIESFEAIDYPSKELIIIDNCSTDETLDLIKAKEAIISYWISEADCGIYDGMNKGWNIAKPGFILFLGAGDQIISLPTKQELQNENAIIGTTICDEIFFRSKVEWSLFLGNTIHHQSLLLKKDHSVSSPFDLRFPIYADFDFNQRLLKSGTKFYFSKRFFSRVRGGGVSSKYRISETTKVVRKNFGFSFVPLAITFNLFQLGRIELKKIWKKLTSY